MSFPYQVSTILCAPDNTPPAHRRPYLIAPTDFPNGSTAADWVQVFGRSMGEVAAYWATRSTANERGQERVVRVRIAELTPSNLHPSGVPKRVHVLYMTIEGDA